jgi:hypothetical protein
MACPLRETLKVREIELTRRPAVAASPLEAFPAYEALTILKPLTSLTSGRLAPAVIVVHHDEPGHTAADFLVDAVHGLQLLPNAADAVVERRKNAVMPVSGEVELGIDAVASRDGGARSRR